MTFDSFRFIECESGARGEYEDCALRAAALVQHSVLCMQCSHTEFTDETSNAFIFIYFYLFFYSGEFRSRFVDFEIFATISVLAYRCYMSEERYCALGHRDEPLSNKMVNTLTF